MPVAGYNPFGPVALRLPAAYVSKEDNPVDRLVRTARTEAGGTTRLRSPLARKVDVWMLAIQVAIGRNRPIPRSSRGLERFVDGVVLQNDPERISLLEVLAISEVAKSAPDGDTGAEIHRVLRTPSAIIDIANRYAAAGIDEVVAVADPSRGYALNLLIELCEELASQAVGDAPLMTEG